MAARERSFEVKAPSSRGRGSGSSFTPERDPLTRCVWPERHSSGAQAVLKGCGLALTAAPFPGLRGDLQVARGLLRVKLSVGSRHARPAGFRPRHERTLTFDSDRPNLILPHCGAHRSAPVRMEFEGRARGATALLALTLVALLPTLVAPFFADDYFHVESAEHLRDALARGWVLPIDSLGAWWTPHGFSVQYFRPLIVVSFAIDRLLYGEHAFGYHLTNFALHACGTLLVWGVARRILGAGFGAWAAAALFGIHPCHTLAVGWISGRTDVLAGVLYVGAFLAYLESRPSPGAPSRPGRSLALAALASGVFAVALLAKEMALTFPVILFADSLLRPRGESGSGAASSPRLWPASSPSVTSRSVLPWSVVSVRPPRPSPTTWGTRGSRRISPWPHCSTSRTS